MKRESLENYTKRIMAGFLTVAMIVTGIVIMPKEVKAEDTTVSEIFYDDAAKTYAIKDYWTDEKSTRKAPVVSGFVFGGWYVKKGDKDVPLKEADLVDGGIDNYVDKAYAKFVPAEVLSIKTQAALGTDTSSLRILSTVDSLNYQEVGFEYKLGIQGEAKTGDIKPITKVYSAIKPHKNAENLLYPKTTFVNDSTYFIAADVSTIQSESYKKIVYARPYWVTMDGTEVMGLARNNRIVDKQNDNQYTSVGINLLTDGKVAAMVAAGKIQVTYNSKDYDVVGATADMTYDATNGGKYRFPEMDCYVNEGEDVGTITFVGNAVIQDDEFIDLLADGLFANVRFENVSEDKNAALSFTIKTGATDFCNWAEEDVKSVVVQ